MKALILKKKAYSESDWVISFLTEKGRVESGLALGARASKRRYPHQFYSAAIYEIDWVAGKGHQSLQRLGACELLKHFPLYSADLEAWARWSTVSEWIWQHSDAEHSFESVCQVLEGLPTAGGPSHYHFYFLNEMRSHGLRPVTQECVICRSKVTGEARFSVSEGGLTHHQCSRGVSLSLELCRFLHLFFDREEGQVHSSELSSSDFLTLDQISLPFLSWQLGQNLKSQHFLETISHER